MKHILRTLTTTFILLLLSSFSAKANTDSTQISLGILTDTSAYLNAFAVDKMIPIPGQNPDDPIPGPNRPKPNPITPTPNPTPTPTPTNYDVGTPKGIVYVNSSGAAVYEIPLDICPSGTGFDPKIGLAYNSQQNSYGNVGYGVNITGISCITRDGKDWYHDHTFQQVKYEQGDNYLLDGKRLYLKSGVSGMDGSTYTVEGNPYVNIKLHGDDSKGNRFVWFEMTDADGNVYRYDKNLRCYFGWRSKQYRNVAWYVTKVTNANGDEINYMYAQHHECMYPRSITYGRNNAKYEISLMYTDLKNPQDFVREGGQIGDVSRRLASVTIAQGTNIYRKYTMEYDTVSDASSRKYDRLQTVNVENGEGKYLAPISLNWNYLKAASVKSCNALIDPKGAFQHEDYKSFYASDFDGDGRSDVVRVSLEHTKGDNVAPVITMYLDSLTSPDKPIKYKERLVYSFVSSSGLYFIPRFPRNRYMGGNFCCDVDGDNYADFFMPYYQNDNDNNNHQVIFHFVKGNEIKLRKGLWYHITCNLQAITELPLYKTFDFNHDGKDEIIYIEQKNKNGIYNGNILSDIDLVSDHAQVSKTVLCFKMSKNQDIRRFFLADCNADGLLDIVLLFDSGYKIYFNNGGDLFSAMFTEDNSRETLNSDALKNYWRVEQGDFDGDGLVDFACVPQTEGIIKLIRNNGDGSFMLMGTTAVDFVDKNTGKDNDSFALRVVDFDKDGRSDIFVSKQDLEYHGGLKNYYKYRKTQVRWFLSDGKKLVLWKRVDKTRNADDSKEDYIFTGDFDGDGYLDIANYGSDLTKATDNTFTENTINIYTFSTDVADGHIKSITNGLGGQTNITYLNGTDPCVYSRGNMDNTGYPVNTYSLATPLVSQVTQSDGMLGKINTYYNYSGLKAHMLGRGILGFTTVTAKKHRGDLTETTTSEITSWDKELWIPNKMKTTVSIGDKTSIQITNNTILKDNSWKGNYFTYPSETVITDYDGFKTTTSCTYDRLLGVPTVKLTSYDDSSDMYVKTNYNDYVACSGKLLPKNITVEKKHADDDHAFIVKKDYEYNDKGFVVSATETSSYHGNSNQLTTEYNRDNYGNVLSAKTLGDNVITVEKCYEYDDNRLRLTKKSTLPSSSTIAYSYDTWGNVISESDISNPSNILTTSHKYDGWGNRILTTTPDSIKTQTKTVWDKNTYNSVFSTTTVTDGRAPITISYDSEGRKVASVTKGKCDIDINTKYNYDSRNGKLSEESIKVGSNTLNSETHYDELGRVITQKKTDGTETRYTYNKREVTEESATGKSTKKYDSWGLLQETYDMGGKVTYTFNSMGLPQKVISNGSTVSMEYDGGGHRTKLIDPDAGTLLYSYAADGRLLSQTDGRGITTDFFYDDLGRQIKRKCGDNIVQTTTYGTSGYDLNKVIHEECNGNSETYHYDKYGRLASDIRTCNGDTYIKKYTYDALGRISSKLFSDKVKADYLYDRYSFLNAIHANGLDCFVQKSYNGIKDVSASGLLKYTETTSPQGLITAQKVELNNNALDSISYSYQEKNLNLKSRTRNGLTEKFSFDEVDRLVSVESNGKVPNANYWFNGKIEYKDNGNITYKTGIGNYNYTSIKPHAVSEILNGEDGLLDTELATSFNEEGKIKSISQNINGLDTRMDFNYGPNGEKWQTNRLAEKRLSNGSISEQLTKHLYFGDYEKITHEDSFEEQYFLGNGIVLVQNNGNFRVYRLFSDRQGSALSAHDINNGEEVFHASYDAWGRQKVDTNKMGLTHGYCGHEMLSDFDLIDMGGRVYEPSTSQFLSCDNYIQAPDKSQNFNRYSYCLNNPLRYTDPSGESFLDFIPYALFGAVTNALQAHASGRNPWKAAGLGFLSSTASFGVGQVFGPAGSIWNEAARAGVHGLSSGLISSWGGGSFRSGFFSGMTSSAVGSYGQSINMPTEAMVSSSALLGGLSSMAFGGNFLDGTINGLKIGLFNHAMHDNNDIMGCSARCERLPDGTYVAQENMDEVIATASKTTLLDIISDINTGIDCIGTSLEKNAENSTIDNKLRIHWYASDERGFYGNQYVKTMKLTTLGKGITKFTGPIGNLLTAAEINMGMYYDCSDYKKTGYTDCYHTAYATASFAGGWVGCLAGAKAGAVLGTEMGIWFEGVGMLPGSVFGGIIGGIYGSFKGSMIGTEMINKIYNR